MGHSRWRPIVVKEWGADPFSTSGFSSFQMLTECGHSEELLFAYTQWVTGADLGII